MDAVFDDLAVKAIKIGMLGNRETISAVADGLMARECPFIVLDPVMVAQSGAALIDDDVAIIPDFRAAALRGDQKATPR